MKTPVKKLYKIRLKTGDKVIVLSGKYKGKTGKIMKTHPSENKVTVEGINTIKKHVKPSQTNPQGGIVTKEAAIHYSNAMLLSPTTKKPARASKFTRGKKGELIEKTASSKK